MDINEVEESLFATSDAKLHGDMCKTFSAIYCKIWSIFASLEAARPRSKSGIQALCALHIALAKSKNILQHCSECSKLYLAITADSVLLKFEKARAALVDSLRRVEDIVSQSIGCQILVIANELEDIVFSLAPLEKQVGDEIISLLQQGRKFDNCSDSNELECFHQAATKLGITSSRTALTERRALKKLIERARAEEDKRKESIVAYLLHLMRKYSKLFRSELTDDNDSQGSMPCSPTIHSSLDEAVDGHAFDRQFSKLNSFNFKPSNRKYGQMPVPPEELRCPISLQVMYDPVIIASGQTYERICIEKWFGDGHGTCPKTQQKLSHLCLTPNYCVKGLVTSWCEQNGVPVPDGPPESLDLNYFRLSLCQSESANSRSLDNISSGKLKVVPSEDSGPIEESEEQEMANSTKQQEEFPLEEDLEDYMFQGYKNLLITLKEEGELRKKCKVVEKIRFLLKDDEEARICMGANGFVEALLRFLEAAVHAGNVLAQEVGAMALFNLAVNNNRNKEMLLAAGVIPLLEMMIANSDSQGSATALYLNLSCLEEAKTIIGSSQAVPSLVQIVHGQDKPQCTMDALHTLYNLSSKASNITNLLLAGIAGGLQSLLAAHDGLAWIERSIAVLINLASNESGKDEIVSTPGLIGRLATILETGEPIEQEQSAACLYILCNGSEKCSQLVLQEGVIPALVSISVNGTARGKEKAQKLLMLFREQRQREQPPQPLVEVRHQRTESNCKGVSAQESKPLYKSVSRRKMVKALSIFRKSKGYSVYQC